MPNAELISEYVDLDATGKQTKALLDQLAQVEAKFDKLNSIKLDLSGASGGAQVTSKLKQAAEVTGELTHETLLLIAAEKEQDKINQQLVNSAVKLAAQETQEAKALAIVNKELRDNTAELKNQVRETQSAEGSIEQLRATLIRLQKEYDNLSGSDRAADDGVKLKTQVKALSDELKKLEGETGRFQRNVGNYSGATKILEKALEQVNQKLGQNTKDSKLNADAVEALVKEQQLLQQFVQAQAQGFKTASAEIKENTLQLQQMAAAGLEGTEAYRALFAATSDLKDETADLKAALNNAAPDDVAFNAAADAARGLVGVYGLVQSATAIFGVENEALAETMVKLQAAETALQSIEAIRAIFKKENAVFQAKEIIQGKIILAQKALEGAAESKNIVVKYLAIGAQKALNAVTSAAGGPLFIIIAALTALVVLLSSFGSANEEAAKSQALINAEMEEGLKLLDRYNEATNSASDINIANLQANFATEKKIRSEQIALIRSQLKETAIYLTENRKNYDKAQAELKAIAERTVRTGQTKLSDDEKKQVEEYEKTRDQFDDAQKRRDALETQREVALANDRRSSTEEQAKEYQLRIEILQKNLADQAKVFQIAAGDEEKTYAERIKATEDFYKKQTEIIQLEAKKQLATPGQTPNEIKKIENEKTVAIKEANRERSAQVIQFQKEEAARIKAAQYEIVTAEISARADANAAIANNEDIAITERSDALSNELQERVKLIKTSLANEISLRKGILKDERAALEDKANKEILSLRADYNMRLIGLNNQLLLAEEQNNLAITNKRRDTLLTQLADDYSKRLLTQEQYEKKKFDIEARYSSESLQLVIDSTRKQIEVMALAPEAKKKLLEQLAAYERELAEKTNTDNEAREEKAYQTKVKKVNEFAQLSAGVGDIISTLASIGPDKEIAAIESAINALEKKKQKDIEVATASIQNEQDRAAAITTIEKRAEAEREALERKRRQVEAQRAKTERYITIGRIIADTAAAVVAALGTKPYSPINIALAAATGALGAAQLAKVLATPLPQFFVGKNLDKAQKNDSYEGYAWVGDGGKRELIQREDGTEEITPNVPTLTYVKRNDIIFPDADKALQDITRSGRRAVPSSANSGQPSNADLIRAQERSTRAIVQAVNQKETLKVDVNQIGIMALHKAGNDIWKYIHEQTNWP